MGCAGTKEQSNIADFSKSGSTLESMTLDKLTLKRNKDEFKGNQLSKKEIYETMSQRKLTSGIVFEVKLHTEVPLDQHELYYTIKYSSYEHSWSESSKERDHVSVAQQIEYNYSSDKQMVSEL